MGLLNKLKNVLFEEEEIEEVKEVETIKEVSKSTMELPKINRKPKKENYNFEEETDRELFEAEKTFDFPAFDEEEFDDLVPKKKEESVLVPYDIEDDVKEVKKERNDFIDKVERRVNNSYNSNNVTKKNEYTSTRIIRSTPTEAPKKIFRPSPVISPVYGILDKNYKKEDVLTREEVIEKKNVTLDVDSVRKKAFGTLEEDLANTMTEPIENFYGNEIKSNESNKKEEIVESIDTEEITTLEEEINNELENLLENTVDIEIDVTKEMEIPTRVSKYDEVDEEEFDDTLEDVVEDISEAVPEEVEVEEINDEVSDDTLENDLFDLIDSMYENREDED